MHRIRFFLLLSFALLSGASAQEKMVAASAESEACGKEIQSIDAQVQKLEKEKKVHQDLARQYQKQGDEWQYNSGNIQDGYTAWGKANEERRKAIDLQQQVNLLVQRKQRIIQFYPELWEP